MPLMEPRVDAFRHRGARALVILHEHAVMHPIRHAFQLEELLADPRT
jgi:hypothetical protein